MAQSSTTAAFVSTNSITQGEQAGILWEALFARGLSINFAHRTFAWESEAKGKAHVHCVIIGFGHSEPTQLRLFEYESIKGDPHEVHCSNINPYLTDAPNVFVKKRTQQLNGGPKISYGSMMIDKERKAGDEAGLILSEDVKQELLGGCPELRPYIRELYGGEEYINGTTRWCLWLLDAPPSLWRTYGRLRQRIEGVRRFRAGSSRKQTQALAATPHLFGEIRQPNREYLLIPKVSSETRRYIPIGFVDPAVIASGSALVVAKATLYDFGVIVSAMHHSWMVHVAGRMKSDFQYSNQIVYNNYPWPQDVSDAKRQGVEQAAQAVLDARDAHPDSTLADLYDPLSMPADLSRAHAKLDRAVDKCYRAAAFASERARVEHLFGLYQRLTAPLLPGAGKRGGSR